MAALPSVIVEACVIHGDREHVRRVSFPGDATVGLIACWECGGTGWWGYGPAEDVNGPCVECKGTGRVPIGLR